MEYSQKTNFVRELLTLFFSNFRLGAQVTVAILVLALLAPLVIGKSYTVTGEIIVLSKKLDQGFRSEVATSSGPRYMPVTLTDMETENSILRSLPVIQTTVGTLYDQGKLFIDYSPLKAWVINPLKENVIKPLKNMLSDEPSDPRLELINELSAYVLDDLEIATLPGSNVITVNYTNDDPEMARAVVNGLMETYMERRRNLMASQAPKEFFLKRKNSFQKLVRELEQKRVDLLNNYGAVNPKDETTAVLGDLENGRKEISAMQGNRLRNEKWLEYLKSESKNLAKSDIAQTSLAFSFNGAGASEEQYYVDTEMKQQLEKIAELVVAYNDARFTFKPDSPKVVQLVSQLREQKRRLETLVKNRIKEREQALIILNDTITTNTAALEGLEQRLVRLKQASAEESALATELNAAKDAFFRYSQQYEEFRAEQVSATDDLENVRILTNPVFPLEPSTPKPFLVWVLGGVAAVMGGIVTALVSAWFGRTFATPDQAQSALGVPVIAVFDDPDNSADLPSHWSPAGIWKWLKNPPA
ncbi:Lipopolysaccharide biosynthesis [gamma proteobacterium HdN1]|nr:Lipopolysaccharide biosynthesis [gamma proteobacterium HdN1]